MRIGVIGFGARMGGVVDLMQSLHRDVEIAAITDIRNDVVNQQLRDAGKDPQHISFFTDPDEMLDKVALDSVMIGTRCSIHAQMAIKVLSHNLPVFLEKPIATNMDDLVALRDAADKSSSRAVVSFPLRQTPLVQIAKEVINSGKIGTVEHVQAWNDVPYGGVYYHDWYRDENETQGLFLQKATHDFDYINYLLGIEPRYICAMTSKQVFKGDHPAGLACKDCNEWDECLESPFHLFYTKGETKSIDDLGRKCGFAVDTGNEDSGSAIIRYETGMHVSYSQNFFARNKAGRRGARLLGYKGTVEFDWARDEVKVSMHHQPRVETYTADASTMPHGGGDIVLIDNFVRVVRGEAESKSPLSAGLLSVLMCLKAKESASKMTFERIAWPDDRNLPKA